MTNPVLKRPTRAGVRARLLAVCNLAGSQAALARALDLNPKYIGKWTSGYVTPSTDTYILIGTKLGVSLDWLLLGAGRPPSKLSIPNNK